MKSNLQNSVKCRSFIFKSVLMTVLFPLCGLGGLQAQDVQWKNIANVDNSRYVAVTDIPDGGGFVAVGTVVYASTDAFIAKYDNEGNTVWEKSFGGNDIDRYTGVISVSDGIIAAGYVGGESFGTGDLTDVKQKSANNAEDEGIVVKYDFDGNIIWIQTIGGAFTQFRSIAATPDGGFVVVGNVSIRCLAGRKTPWLGTHDWENYEGSGEGGRGVNTTSGWMTTDSDACIIKFDNAGRWSFKRIFGGDGEEYFDAVTVLPDGSIVVVGRGVCGSRGINPNNWTYCPAGTCDIHYVPSNAKEVNFIKKYSRVGATFEQWFQFFRTDEQYNAVIAVPDGVVAVGRKSGNTNITKYNANYTLDEASYDFDYSNDNIVWTRKYNGGSGVYNDVYRGATAVSDGFIAMGGSGFAKYDHNGNVVWKKDFVGASAGITATSDGFVAVGELSNFAIDDWKDVTKTGEGSNATIVKIKFASGDNTGINETVLSNNVNIYPNPVKDELKIENGEVRIKEVEIFDVYGKKLSTFNSQLSTINVSVLAKGIYFVKIETDKGIVTKKLIKE